MGRKKFQRSIEKHSCLSNNANNNVRKLVTSIHVRRYSPFHALASLKNCLRSSLFSVLLLHPRIPSICSASLWTTSAHLVLGLPTGLVLWNFPFKKLFLGGGGSFPFIWPTHNSFLILIFSTTFRSLYTQYTSLFHPGRQRPPPCIRPYIIHNSFLSNVFSICSVVCVRVQATLPWYIIGFINVLYKLVASQMHLSFKCYTFRHISTT